MNTTSRTLLSSLALSLAVAPGCATDPVTSGPDADDVADDDTSGTPVDDTTPTDPTDPTPVAPGDLDPSFGNAGIRTLPELGHGYASKLAVQNDKLIACITNKVGSAMIARVVRLDSTGAVDTNFGVQGYVTLDAYGNSACREINVRDNGTLDILYRSLQDNKIRHLQTTGAGVKTTDALSVAASAISNASYQGTAISYGVLGAGDTQSVYVDHPNGRVVASTSSALAGSTSRAFVIGGNTIYAVGRYAETGAQAHTWQVLVDATMGGPLVAAGAGAKAGAEATPDFLHDTVLLPDGSVFAVGGVDTDLQVMAARFVPADSTVEVEHHMHGPATSSGRAVALDGMSRPIVVGTGSKTGGTRFAWQRYEAASVTLDQGYQKAGLGGVDAPSGSGELMDIVRLGDKLYAFGHYDVETDQPKLALVRIAE